jgi:hypothetical protein
MTGLLRRLAERTLNDGVPRMRPLPPTPWLSARVVSDALEAATPAADSARDVDTTRHFARTHARTPEGPDSPTAGAVEEPDVFGASPFEPTSTFSGAAIPIPQAHTTTAPTNQGEPLELQATVPNPPLARPDQPLARSVTTPPPRPAESGEQRVGAWRVPAPLLAPTLDVEPAVSGPDIAIPVSGEERATEVHVHIGRVELTAVQEPSAKLQRAASKDKPGRSLDDYLRQRKERLR